MGVKNGPTVLNVNRTGHILEGVVASRSDPEQRYYPRILLYANLLDTCKGSQMQDARCVHLRAILEEMPKEELVDLILEAQHIPGPITPEEP